MASKFPTARPVKRTSLRLETQTDRSGSVETERESEERARERERESKQKKDNEPTLYSEIGVYHAEPHNSATNTQSINLSCIREHGALSQTHDIKKHRTPDRESPRVISRPYVLVFSFRLLFLTFSVLLFSPVHPTVQVEPRLLEQWLQRLHLAAMSQQHTPTRRTIASSRRL